MQSVAGLLVAVGESVGQPARMSCQWQAHPKRGLVTPLCRGAMLCWTHLCWDTSERAHGATVWCMALLQRKEAELRLLHVELQGEHNKADGTANDPAGGDGSPRAKQQGAAAMAGEPEPNDDTMGAFLGEVELLGRGMVKLADIKDRAKRADLLIDHAMKRKAARTRKFQRQ